jgi:hypothetical protein
MSSASLARTNVKFIPVTRCLAYAKVWSFASEEHILELARSVAPIGWIADTGAWWCDRNDCWIVDFELAAR